MTEPNAPDNSAANDLPYGEILTSIVQRFVRLVGIPAALKVARRVPGLTVDKDGQVTSFDQADPLSTIQRLLDEYSAVFGEQTVNLPPHVKRTIQASVPSAAAPLRILLVDDRVLFRSGLARLIGAQPDFKIVGEASTMNEAIVLARDTRPDLVLMDISLPDGTGLDATNAILAELPGTKIVFLTVHEDDEHLFAAIRAGGIGYLLKNVGATDLVGRLRAVRRGEAAISPGIARRILDEFSRLPTLRYADAEKIELTPREVDIVRMVARGASNREIANQLVISENTVKNHVQNVLTKLHLHSRRDVRDYARTRGLIPPANNPQS